MITAPIPVVATEAPSDLPPGALTVGAQAGDGTSEGFADVLVPIHLTESGILCVNPRFSVSDDEEEELNLGIVYRHLFPERNVIVGGNVYYDSRWTENDNQFHQVGVGAEILTEWIDARANYYLPDDDEELADTYTESTVESHTSTSVHWRDPYAEGHQILQEGTVRTRTTTTTTTYLFEQYEQAREGYDAEVGVKLPGLDDYAEVRVFGGYYHWDSEVGGRDDIEGFKGRVEVRAMPAVFLDAQVFEDDDLNGTDWYIGGRLNMPFDSSRFNDGGNPFEGAFARQETSFANRMLEMVIRDLKVQTELSDWEENPDRRTVDVDVSTSRRGVDAVILDDVIFVDEKNGNNANPGTDEQRKATIQNGADSAFGDRNVYVYNGNYNENVLLGNAHTDTKLYGEGCAIKANGGKKFGGGKYPVVDGTIGLNSLPCFRLVDADNVMIRGFDVMHSATVAPLVQDGLWNLHPISLVGIEAENADNLLLRCNRAHNNSWGALILSDAGAASGVPDYNVEFRKNNFFNNGADGAMFDVRGGSGTFTFLSSGDAFNNNGDMGLQIGATNFDMVTVGVVNGRANGNGADGINLGGIDNNVDVQLLLRDVRANNNTLSGINGVDITQVDEFLGTFDGLTLNDNLGAGMALSVAATGPVFMALADIDALRNGPVGLSVTATSEDAGVIGLFGADGAFYSILDAFGIIPQDWADIKGSGLIRASDNGGMGIVANFGGRGGALASFFDLEANRNQGGFGVMASCVSTDGFGAITFLPTRDLLEVAQGGADIITSLFGLPNINLPMGRDHGAIQVNNNLGGGIFTDIRALDFSIFAAFDVQANNNTGFGIMNTCMSTGVAVSVLGAIEANNNIGFGVINTVDGRDAGINAMIDFQANNNIGFGVMNNVNSDDGIAANIMTTTRRIDGVMDLIGGALGFPIGLRDFGMKPAGPNRANGNTGVGIMNTTYGTNAAITVVDDTRINGNLAGMGLMDTTTSDGTSIGIYSALQANNNVGGGLMTTVAGDDLAIAAHLGEEANNNIGIGIMNIVDGRDNAAVNVMVDFQANNNIGGGVMNNVISDDGTAINIMTTTRRIEGLLDLIGLPISLRDLGIKPAGPNRANDNLGFGVMNNTSGTNTAITVVDDMRVNRNLGFGLMDTTASYGTSIALYSSLQANNNIGWGIMSTVGAENTAVGAFLDFEANNNLGNGVLANITSSQGDAFGVMASSRILVDAADALGGIIGLDLPKFKTSGPNEANNNTGNGLALNVTATGTAVAVVLDAKANNNTVNGMSTLVNSDGGSAIGVQWGVTANDNGVNGITQLVDADGLAVGVTVDFQANDNGVNGFSALVNSDTDTAIGVVASTRFIREAGDAILDLLGAPFNMPKSLNYGPNKANRNGVNGFSMLVDASNTAVNVVLDVEANRNLINGISTMANSGGGDAIGVLWNVEANRNGVNGISQVVDAYDLAVGGLIDFQANKNGIFGLNSLVDSENGDAYGFMASTRLIDEVGSAVLDLLGAPIDMPKFPTSGPNQANENGVDGMTFVVNASNTAVAAVLDTVANGNGASGMRVISDSSGGDAFTALWRVKANDNVGGLGIFAQADAFMSGNAFVVDFRADNNGLSGLTVDVDALNSDSIALIASSGFAEDALKMLGGGGLGDIGIDLKNSSSANGNGGNGVNFSVTAQDQVIAGIFGVEANNNTLNGFQVDLDCTADDVYSAFSQIKANRNGANGFFADIDGVTDVVGIMLDVKANNNVAQGAIFDLAASGGNVYAALFDVTTDENAAGLMVRLNATENVLAGFSKVHAWDNTVGDGIFVDANSTAAGGAVGLIFSPDAAGIMSNSLAAIGIEIPGPIIDAFPQGRVSAWNNAGNGLNVDADAVGSATVIFDRTKAKLNGLNGINLSCDSTGGNAGTVFLGNRASHNGGAGINVALNAAGTAMLIGMDNGTRYNTTDGWTINAAGAVINLDLGGGASLSPGRNIIANNGGFGVNNIGGGTVSVENNWWDGNAPVPGVDYSPISVADPATFLTTKP